MLQELFIKNIALIRELSISFDEGLNILSGETGAGKTIIVDSMSLVLGERGSKELIKHGEEKAFVEAMFSPDDAGAAKDILEESGIDSDELIVSRELTSAGKNVCRINGRMVSLGVLKSVMSRIINLHGQGQHSEIFEKKHQLEMLDRYAGCSDELEKAAKAYSEYTNVKKRLEAIDTDEKELQRMADMLAYQKREIEAAALRPGEDDELSEERTVMHNSEKISAALNGSHGLISADDGALIKLRQAAHMLEGISAYGEKYSKLAETVNDAYYAIEDASYELSDCIDEAVFDEGRLDEIEMRIDVINSLKRKYGSSIEDVLEYAEKAEKQLQEIEHSDELKKELENELENKKCALQLAAAKLTEIRKDAAKKLEQELIGHLKDLGMGNAGFYVNFSEKAPDRKGADDIEFYITLNLGEPEKPLAKVASGGEASRIMLAIKNIFASREAVSTLIFDEIDTGISGNMARMVARKLANISKERQVICVSHLPQLAAMGDANFEIVKTDDELGTVSTVNKLDNDGKIKEIARLSGGIQSGAAEAHAKELLEECISFKASVK